MTPQNITNNIEEIAPIGTLDNEPISETEREEIISEIIPNEIGRNLARYAEFVFI